MPLDPKRLLVVAPLGRVDRVVARLSRAAAANPVLEADSLASALDTLESHPCDLVFWDAESLPASDLDQLLAAEGAPPVVAIVVDESAAMDLLLRGAAEVLVRDDSDGDAVMRTVRRAYARGKGELRRHARREGESRHHPRLISAAVDAATVLVLVTDPEGAIRYVNAHWSEVTGYRAEDVLGRNPRILKSDKTPPEEYRRLWGTLLDGRMWRGRLVNRRADGTEFVEEKTITPIRSEDGGIERFISVGTDVTEMVSLQVRVAAIQRMEAIGRLTAGMGHDFNNLLGVVIAHADLLAGSLPLESLDAEVAESLQQISAAAEAGRDLVSALLAYGRRSRIRPERLDVGQAVTRQADLLRRAARQGIVIDVDVAEGMDESEVDAGTFEQILLNLVVNAQDAMANGGHIRIVARPVTVDESFDSPEVRVPPGRYSLVQVTDEGHGMDPPTLKRIYDPFFTTKGSDKRTGLGLAMAYGVMKQHEGYILTESEPGSGTSVRLLFPVAGEGSGQLGTDLPLPGSTEEAVPVRAPHRRPKVGDGTRLEGGSRASSGPGRTREAPGGGEIGVLYAEDNAPLRRAGRRVLESGGFVVFEAEDGQRALELFEEHEGEIDFVLSDLVMPEMSGAELYRRLSERRRNLPFILTSGHVDQALDMRDHLPSHVPYILKPWSPDELLEIVRRVLYGDLSPAGG